MSSSRAKELRYILIQFSCLQLGLQNTLCPSSFSTWILHAFRSVPKCKIFATNLALLYLITLINYENYHSQGHSFCNFLLSPVTFYLLDLNVIFCTLFLNTLRPYSSLNVRNHIYTQRDNKNYFSTLVVNSLKILGSKREVKKILN